MRPKKSYWFYFVLAVYCWTLCLTLKVVCIPSEAGLEKIIFHWEKLSFGLCFWVKDVSLCLLSSQCWDRISPELCRPSAHYEFLWALALLCSEDIVYLVCSVFSDTYFFPASSLFCKVLWFLRKGDWSRLPI